MTAPPSFTCPRCGRTSYNINDVREGYCGNCHAFTGTGPAYPSRNQPPFEQPSESRTQQCPNCGDQVTMVPYDIGSGPEISCPACEWCWGADGQPLKPVQTPPDIQEYIDQHLGRDTP